MNLSKQKPTKEIKNPQNKKSVKHSNGLLERIKNRKTPHAVLESGDRFSEAFWEFFKAEVGNQHTRQAYQLAIFRFLDWCSERGITLHQLQSRHLNAYFSQHPGSPTTMRQHLSAIRKLFNRMVTLDLLPNAPNISTDLFGRNQKTTRPTPTAAEARMLLDSVDTSNVVGLRDRALIGVLIFCFSRVGQVTNLKVEDYIKQEHQSFLRFPGRGGSTNLVPVHHLEQEYLESYLESAGTADSPAAWLFRTSNRSRSRNCLMDQPLTRKSTLKMLKRRIEEAGLSNAYDCQSFRRTGIVEYLKNGGSIEAAARIAGYESTRSIEAFLEKNDALDEAEINRLVI